MSSLKSCLDKTGMELHMSHSKRLSTAILEPHSPEDEGFYNWLTLVVPK